MLQEKYPFVATGDHGTSGDHDPDDLGNQNTKHSPGGHLTGRVFWPKGPGCSEDITPEARRCAHNHTHKTGYWTGRKTDPYVLEYNKYQYAAVNPNRRPRNYRLLIPHGKEKTARTTGSISVRQVLKTWEKSRRSTS